MASIEVRPNGNLSVNWRNNGRTGKQRVPLGADCESLAEQIKAYVNARRNKVTSEEVERMFGLLLEVDDDGGTAVAAPTFESWFERWLETRSRLGGQHRTVYRSMARRVFNPAIGATPIDQIRGGHITDILMGLIAAGRKARTADRYYEVLNSLFRFAVAEEKIGRNPVRDSDWEHGRLSEYDLEEAGFGHVYLTREQFQVLRRQFDHDSQMLVDYLAATGSRFGEATALIMSDLDLREAKPRVRIRRAWKKAEDGTRFVGSTKGRGARWVSIGGDFAARLRTYVEAKAPDDLVFTTPTGRPWRNDRFLPRRWRPAIAAAKRCPQHPPTLPVKGPTGPARKLRLDEVSTCGCPGLLDVEPTPHDLRHSFAAWQIAAGKPIAAVSRALGHKSVQTTDTIYAGILPEVSDSFGDVTDAILKEVATV